MARTPLMDHNLGRSLLLELADVFDEMDLPFFLMQGTVLGAYRDGGFTPTERDIDLGFRQEDFTPLAKQIVYVLTRMDYQVVEFSAPFTKTRTIKAKKHGINCDLVSWMFWKGWRFAHNTARTIQYCIVHDAEMLEQTEPIELFGRTFGVPSPVEEYLELEYGPDWRTPADDNVSRTRVPNFIQREGVPLDLLDA